MPLLGGAYPVVLPYLQLGPCQAEGFVHAIYPDDGIYMLGIGSFENMLTILIEADTEVRIVAQQAMIAGDNVGSDFFE